VDETTREILNVLGDGGTVAMAERVRVWLESRPSVDHLVGVAEVAKAYGVSAQAVSNWRKREPDTCPEPIRFLAMGPVWDIRDWKRIRSR
jgi:hypothetical protein